MVVIAARTRGVWSGPGAEIVSCHGARIELLPKVRSVGRRAELRGGSLQKWFTGGLRCLSVRIEVK